MSRPAYEKALIWIVRERGGGGGHPPQDVMRVSGWIVTRLIADLFDLPVRQVAKDVVEMEQLHAL